MGGDHEVHAMEVNVDATTDGDIDVRTENQEADEGDHDAPISSATLGDAMDEPALDADLGDAMDNPAMGEPAVDKNLGLQRVIMQLMKIWRNIQMMGTCGKLF